MRGPPAWFRRLLLFLPEDFRAGHAEEICDLTASYAEGRSLPGRTLVWLRSALDVASVALAARVGKRGEASSRLRPGGGGVGHQRRSDPGIGWEGWRRDARHGFRALRHDPGFTIFAILIVGLGIGPSVTVFSVVRALLLRPLPFLEPERLVWVSNGDFGRGQQLSTISVQAGYLVDLRSDASQFSDVGGFHLFDGDGDHTLAGGGDPQRVTRLRVTENFFDVLGVTPLLGRYFTAEEAWDDGPPAIVLTYGFWRRHFAADPDVLGTAVRIDDVPTTIVGVLPPSFDFGSIFQPGRSIDYVAPFPLSARSDRTGNTLGLIARLAPGATPASAEAEATAIAGREIPPASDVYSGRRNDFRPVVSPLREHVSGSFRPAMALLIGAVVLVMLMVCANLSNLLLARGATREREMAIRAAMGAGRRRLVRQMLTESTLLSGAGALLGVVMARAGTTFMSSLDLRIPLLDQTRVDGPALALALFAAVAVGLLFGVAPALRVTDLDLQESLKDSGRGASAGSRRGALRSTLVVSQIAFATVLLVASSLVGRSLLRLLDVDLGYDTERAVVLRIDPSVRFASDAERLTYYASALGRVRAIPQVTAVGLSDVLPMAFNRRWSVRLPDDPEDRVSPFVRMASDGYVDAMGLTLTRGRDLGPEDGPDAARVALVNEVMEARLWPDGDALGSTFVSSGREYTVVGIVRSTRQLSVDQAPGPEMFFSIRQSGDQGQVYLIIRSARSVDDVVAAVRRELRSVDPGIPLDRVTTLRAIVDASLAPRRFLVILMTSFAGFALVLSTLGIYAVIAYSVAQRRREIGIHIALGASAQSIEARLLRETMVLSTAGLALGLLGAMAGARIMRSLLFGVTPLDPTTYLVVAATFALASALAGYLPARRAARTSPVETLTADAVRPTGG